MSSACHLTAFANCNTSCGSLLMFGNTVCRTIRPSNARPARCSTRADRMLSTWQMADMRKTFGSLSISAMQVDHLPHQPPTPPLTAQVVAEVHTVHLRRPKPARADDLSGVAYPDQPAALTADVVEHVVDNPPRLGDVRVGRPRHIARYLGVGGDRGEQFPGV